MQSSDYGNGGGGYGGASQYGNDGYDVNNTSAPSRQRVPSTMSTTALQQRSETITPTGSVGVGGGRGYRSTGDPEADAQLEAMHRAREEMRARLAASRTK